MLENLKTPPLKVENLDVWVMDFLSGTIYPGGPFQDLSPQEPFLPDNSE